jgi:hypothetical protein
VWYNCHLSFETNKNQGVMMQEDYIKVSTTIRFKSSLFSKKQKTKSKTVLNSANIYPFSSTVLTDFAF